MASSSSSLSLSKKNPAAAAAAAATSSSSSLNAALLTASPLLCRHSSSATLDLLILILVLFSGSFLVLSYLSYIFHSLSLLLPHLPPISLLLPLSLLLLSLLSFEIYSRFFSSSSNKCSNPQCKGLNKSAEFDLQMQTEEVLKGGGGTEVDGLPWKGGTEGNPDYECLRAELRKMAPPNGRAVLLFRAKCGCPVAKLEGWAQKRGRRNKNKALALSGGDQH